MGVVGVFLMVMKEVVELEGEWGERFIVGWIEVDVVVEYYKVDDKDWVKEDIKV